MSLDRASVGSSTISRRRPTIWQIISNKPSRSYRFPSGTQLHSIKSEMAKAAQGGLGPPPAPAPFSVSAPTTPVPRSTSDDSIRNKQEIRNTPYDIESEGSTRSSLDDSDDNGNESFYTPATTPRQSIVQSKAASTKKDLSIDQVVIGPITTLKNTNTLRAPPSSMTTSPTASQDSLLTSSRSPVTSATSLPPKSAGSYTDEDWTRDSESPRNYRPSLPRIVSHPATSTPSTRRTPPTWRSSSSSLNRVMSVVLEEDETSGTAPEPPPLPSRAPVARPIMTTEMDNPQSRAAVALALSIDRPRSATLSRAASESEGRRRASLPPLSRATSSVASDTSSTRSYHSKKSSPLTSSTSVIIPPPPQNASESLPSRATQHYTSLTLPMAPYDPSLSSRRTDAVDLTRSGDAQTTMATVEVVSGLASASTSSFLTPLRRSSSKSTSEPILGFTHHLKPPSDVPASGLIVQVWAVALDRLDVNLLRGKEAGYIPGRSFLGRVYMSGHNVSDRVAKRGDWIIGLLEVHQKCGALSQFIIVDRHRIMRVNHPFVPKVPSSSLYPGARPPTMGELVLLPLIGVPAYRSVHAIRTHVLQVSSPYIHSSSARRILILCGHTGAGSLAARMFAKLGWHVVVHAPTEYEFEEKDEYPPHDYTLLKRRLGVADIHETRNHESDVVEFINSFIPLSPPLPPRRALSRSSSRSSSYKSKSAPTSPVHVSPSQYPFDAVLDTYGGRAVWEACTKIIPPQAPFVTLVGDDRSSAIPTKWSRLEMRKRSGYLFVSADIDLDWDGKNIQDSLEDFVKAGVRIIEDIDGPTGCGLGGEVPMEDAGKVLLEEDTKAQLNEGGTLIVKIAG